MRFLVTILLLFVYSAGFAGTSDTTIKKVVLDFDQALITKDSIALKKLLHEDLTYGHSNGWIESKSEVIDDLFNGKLAYNKIEQHKIGIVEEGGVAMVRSVTDVDVLLNGKTVQLKLHILQVWIKKKKGWKLLGRQSTKI